MLTVKKYFKNDEKPLLKWFSYTTKLNFHIL